MALEQPLKESELSCGEGRGRSGRVRPPPSVASATLWGHWSPDGLARGPRVAGCSCLCQLQALPGGFLRILRALRPLVGVSGTALAALQEAVVMNASCNSRGALTQAPCQELRRDSHFIFPGAPRAGQHWPRLM